MQDRLGIPPDEAVIGWSGDQSSAQAQMAVRTTALAINKQSHGSTFDALKITRVTRPATWQDGMARANAADDAQADSDARAVFATFGILSKYISNNVVAASDFESGIKESLTKLDLDTDEKKKWFVKVGGGYGEVRGFGEKGSYEPTNHPMFWVSGGLASSAPGGDQTTFSTAGPKAGCGKDVWANNAPEACNLSPLATYNYLNTSFGSDSMTLFSSTNVTSGFTRESHMAVSQVGTGPAKFTYWLNSMILLGSIALLGFWYALGMLVGSVKRTMSLIAAIPFATLGAMAAISKVIVYSIALILEVIVTLFLYQFVSDFLISIPRHRRGPGVERDASGQPAGQPGAGWPGTGPGHFALVAADSGCHDRAAPGTQGGPHGDGRDLYQVGRQVPGDQHPHPTLTRAACSRPSPREPVECRHGTG